MNQELVIPVLAGGAVVAIGGAGLLVRQMLKAPLQERLRGLADGTMAVSPQSDSRRFADVVQNLGAAVSSGTTSRSLREKLTQAGYHDPNAAAIYLGAKALLFAVALLACGVLTLMAPLDNQTKILLTMTGSLGLFFVPNMVVASRRARRRGDIRRHLPDAIDLLEICASAGMGIDMAWNSVTEEVRAVSPVLADEMALTNLEIHLGAARAQAMRHMAERTGADELSSLVAVLVQSDRFGTSITDAMRTFATSMRETRSQRAQESAEKMAVKLIFPMIVFIFPAAVLVMAGPAFIMLEGVMTK
ncbi:MAG TPA: type II secretion system F family protein [Tepidisphaeraceae bacterium]|jgi:tight adherence protein C|nr:type II secretion system F family protein [Tepidisphaeraceae bacterium]